MLSIYSAENYFFKALRRGIWRQRLIDFANVLKDYKKLTPEQQKELWREVRQNDAMDIDAESGDENQIGEHHHQFVRPTIPVTYERNLTDNQRRVYNFIVDRIENNIQLLLCVCGEVGNTFLINALIAYFLEKQN